MTPANPKTDENIPQNSFGPPGIEALEETLKPLSKYYQDGGIAELIVCNPQKVFLRYQEHDPEGPFWEGHTDQELTMEYLDMALNEAARVFSIRFDRSEHPIISDTISCRDRFTAIRGPAVIYHGQTDEGGVMISIRPRATGNSTDSLEDWGIRQNTTINDITQEFQEENEPVPNLKGPIEEVLRAAIIANKSIMISGAPRTGKTTLLNCLLAELNPNLRVVTVEDRNHRELRVKNLNRTHLMMDYPPQDNELPKRGLNAQQLMDTVVRLPENILALSEIKPHNVSLAMRLLQVGYLRFWTTICCGENCKNAFEMFAWRAAQSCPHADSKKIIDRLKKRMVAFHVAGTHGQRKIVDFYWPQH